MRKIQVLRDDEGHWYIVPNEMKDRFNELLNKLYEDDIIDETYYETSENFEKEFGKFRTGGDLNLVQLYAEL